MVDNRRRKHEARALSRSAGTSYREALRRLQPPTPEADAPEPLSPEAKRGWDKVRAHYVLEHGDLNHGLAQVRASRDVKRDAEVVMAKEGLTRREAMEKVLLACDRLLEMPPRPQFGSVAMHRRAALVERARQDLRSTLDREPTREESFEHANRMLRRPATLTS